MGETPAIPLHRPLVGAEEAEALARCLTQGHLTGDGPVGRRVEAMLEQITGSRHVLLTTSATASLELSLELLDVGPGDEVVCPSFSFPSSANAILLRGATPIFADIDEDTLCLDPADVAVVATDATKAVMPVDYAGVSADLAGLRAACPRDDVAIVEDAAHGIGARAHGRHLGIDSECTALSFHATKNLTSGEGGALLLQDDSLATRAEILREKGTNRAAFVRGEVARYEWVDVGTSGAPSDLLSALLEIQLGNLDSWTSIRQHQAETYEQAFADLYGDGLLRPQTVPEGCEPNGHLYCVRTTDAASRSALSAHMASAQIEAPIHFVPLHSTAYAARRLGPQRTLPVTDRVGATLMRLPIGPHLSEQDQQRVVDEVRAGLGLG